MVGHLGKSSPCLKGPLEVRDQSKGAERESNVFVCNLFLISHKHALLVPGPELSCQAGSLQLPPENTSEVIPSKAQNPEIKKGSNSAVTGLVSLRALSLAIYS